MILEAFFEQLFVWQLVLRSEHFLLACPTYHAAWHQRVAVVLAYNTLFAYVYFGFTSLTHRQTRVAVLWAGLSGLALAVLALNAWTTPLRQGPAPCAYTRTEPRLSEEAAVLMYFSGFYWLHTLVLAPTLTRLVLQLLGLLVFWVASLWPLVHLDLHAPSAVLAGVVAGLGSALVSFAVFHWLHRRQLWTSTGSTPASTPLSTSCLDG